MDGPFKQNPAHSVSKNCPSCGQKNAAAAAFCIECGAKFPAPPAEESNPQKNSRSKRARMGILLGCVLILVSVAAIPFFNKLTYSNALEKGNSVLASADYDAAIAQFEKAIKKQPQETEPYLLLATAYTETRDLYSAREVLMEGYAQTGDPTLEDVSIWGPLPEAEIALFMANTDCSIPIIRAQYLFSGTSITGNIHTTEQENFCLHYQLDETTKQIKSLFLVNSWYRHGNGTLALFDPVDGYSLGYRPSAIDAALDNVLTYTYDDAQGKVSLCTEDNDIRIDVTSAEDGTIRANVTQKSWIAPEQGGFDYSNPSITFEYDNSHRISRLSAHERTYSFTYDTDGNFIVTSFFSDEHNSWEFNSDGYLVNAEWDVGWPILLNRSLNNSGDVTKVYTSFPDISETKTVQYTYLDDGRLDCIIETSTDYSSEPAQDAILEIRCTYNDDGQLVTINYNEYDAYGSNDTYRTIEYDNQGRYASMKQKSTNDWWIWESTYQYLENGALDTITVFEPYAIRTFQFTYDEFGNLINIKETG